MGFPFYNTLSLAKKEHFMCSSQVATQLGMHRKRVQKKGNHAVVLKQQNTLFKYQRISKVVKREPHQTRQPCFTSFTHVSGVGDL